MLEFHKRIDGSTRVKGHETREAAEAHVQRLRERYEIGYGFWLKVPVELTEDGTWGFSFMRGSTCD